MTDPKQDKVFGKFNHLLDVTKDEDDRGLVLSIAAFSEDCLGRLLTVYFREGKAASDLIEGFNAPLGTFSARIKASYAMGLLTDNQFKDLELTRKIRNEFAHNWEGCSFEKENIKDWTANMSISRIHDKIAKSPRNKFHYTMTCTLVELEFLRSNLEDKAQKVPLATFQIALKPPH